MIRVEAPSRLHFGLLSLPGDTESVLTVPHRHFGGVGLMIDRPGLALTLETATDWSSQGRCADRALAVAKMVCAKLGITQSFAINVERCPAEHVGLGTGTQLSLAVARAIALATNHEHLSVVELARLTGRGRRSAIGIHGFERGGFLVEAGKRHDEDISPLVARMSFSEDWKVLLVIPNSLQGDHGQTEAEAFQRLKGALPTPARTASLCRMVLLGMLPAIAEHDLDAFGTALYEFNRCVGEVFHGAGHYYSHPRVAEIVDFLRKNGVQGVGQSSWGPAVFAVTEADRAERLASALVMRFNVEKSELLITGARNDGAFATAATEI
ncbi:MAG TPA: beta-ribofuranosylaminobenzene 5'-phosphate synthase family protein [Gemmataceae bacterium]|nr:beta-ribofuranosylaminobenzene 5'-phosphate synthase family protein [Gemmataceae bacterium]